MRKLTISNIYPHVIDLQHRTAGLPDFPAGQVQTGFPFTF